MFSLYLVLKYIHILSAIVAVGANITYGIWTVRGQQEPAHTGFALKGIRFLDNRVANPAYGVLLLTGLLLVFAGTFRFTQLWILIALVLFAALIVVGIFAYTPALRDQVKLAEAGDTSSPDFARLARRARLAGPATGLIVLVILAMMVFKPGL
jgi:uncharacterized membrane protein